ncbi:hypothetical protein CPB83DRAFT_863433 [Crepidotus variabilis]|uniref:Uncharacterized protein n=1 Tax=Crepidotus variabilis TaxID=179855 RepID=A0A9P6E5R9_9AGAR|nr:hypothetical protein CPB83DRAFT_863433 [Crepidotus variabilis]
MSDHLTELEQCITEFAATVFLEYSGTCKPRGYFATSIDRRLQHETLGDLQELELFLDEIGDKDALSHTDKERLGIFRRSFRGSCDQVKIWSGLSGTHSYSVASAVLGQANVPVPVASTEYTATGPSLHGISPARADEINQIQEDANLASLIDAQEWEEWAIEAREQAVPARRSKQNETNCQRTRVSPSKTTIQPSGNGHHYYYHATPSTNVQSSWDASAFLSPVFVPPLRTSFHTTVHTASRSGASSSQTVSYNSHNTSFTNIRNSFNNP